jgi:hypothetical protein
LQSEFDRTTDGDGERRDDLIVFRVLILLVEADEVQFGIFHQRRVGAPERRVRPRVMKVPLKLLRDDVNFRRTGGRFVQVQLRPHALSHQAERDEDERGDGRPDDLQTIVAVRIDGALFPVAPRAVTEDRPAQPDLRHRKRNAHDDDRDQELAVIGRAVFGNIRGQPPAAIHEQPHRPNRQQPDQHAERTTHHCLLS